MLNSSKAQTKRTGLKQISGTDLKRFVVHSALLSLIDPVRGEPTRSSLDENPNGDVLGGQQLRQKFLDSFALICSTSSSGAESASAVCLEWHASAPAILRVARNHGLTPGDMRGLENVLEILQTVARKEKSSPQAESEILYLVVELTRDRILSIAERTQKRGIIECLRQASSELVKDQARPEILAEPGFKPWLDSCPFTASSLDRPWNPLTIALLVNWASQARWTYSTQFKVLFGITQSQKPDWMNNLYKIARYRSAIKSMVKLAVKQPDIFAQIQIRELKAPSQSPFSLKNDRGALQTAVKRLIKENSRETMQQLEKHLDSHDVEAVLRKACRLSLTLHAEMQLVVFYEENPESAPRMRFIGTSKKACFLCYKYLLQHPLGLQVSACHQKIYPSWMPPPYYPISGKFKNDPFIKLDRDIEQLTRKELKTALNAARRPKNYDSTAGPSLTLTATVSTEVEAR
ncbi:hypothetical protein FVEN_g11863 [Fusarium venenatum]|uniref:uncharacterized protein n=1 Tax=Fusarium venenatum TaxID=56646 RepID=UPI001DFBE038|nr:hypothetical protein FVEN_g11863 [Fusarium venenatum]KAH6965048.1 hypothetical protein EDB82DRAFT_511466 [Fusarium venenatum]